MVDPAKGSLVVLTGTDVGLAPDRDSDAVSKSLELYHLLCPQILPAPISVIQNRAGSVTYTPGKV